MSALSASFLPLTSSLQLFLTEPYSPPSPCSISLLFTPLTALLCVALLTSPPACPPPASTLWLLPTAAVWRADRSSERQREWRERYMQRK